jgi:hypothetical protein
MEKLAKDISRLDSASQKFAKFIRRLRHDGLPNLHSPAKSFPRICSKYERIRLKHAPEKPRFRASRVDPAAHRYRVTLKGRNDRTGSDSWPILRGANMAATGRMIRLGWPVKGQAPPLFAIVTLTEPKPFL